MFRSTNDNIMNSLEERQKYMRQQSNRNHAVNFFYRLKFTPINLKQIKER